MDIFTWISWCSNKTKPPELLPVFLFPKSYLHLDDYSHLTKLRDITHLFSPPSPIKILSSKIHTKCYLIKIHSWIYLVQINFPFPISRNRTWVVLHLEFYHTVCPINLLKGMYGYSQVLKTFLHILQCWQITFVLKLCNLRFQKKIYIYQIISFWFSGTW